MEPWRLGLLIAAAVFFAYMLYRLRPASESHDSDPPSGPAPSRAELYLWKRIAKLPREAQVRTLERLERHLGSEASEPGEPDDRG